MRKILTYLGCILLLVGNALPWPNIGSYSIDFNVLQTFHLRESWLGIFLVAAVLLLPAAVYFLRSPLNTAAWLSFWALVYLLLSARIFAVYDGSQVWFKLPIILVNSYLPSQAELVLPLSLLTYWLFIRPQNLQKGWKAAAAASLVVLLASTFYLYSVDEARRQRLTEMQSPFIQNSMVGYGPLTILLGGLILLGILISELRRAPAPPATEARPAPVYSRRYRVIAAGYWAAISVIVCTGLPIILVFSANYTGGTGAGIYLLFTFIFHAAATLLLVSTAILWFCIHQFAEDEKKGWSRAGLILAAIYAAGSLFNSYIYPIIFRDTQLYSPDSAAASFLTRLEARNGLNFMLLALAGLCIVPVFHKKGIETALRWILVATALLSIAGLVGIAASDRRVASVPLLLIMAAQDLLIPAAAAIIAVIFKRAGTAAPPLEEPGSA